MGKRKSKSSERKPKLNLVFDEEKRREFLCGFRKRKLERKKKAQDDLKRRLKEEKKRIKQENKESYKKLVVSSRPIPDLEQLLQEEYEDEDVNVRIVELSTDMLKKKDLWIGENKPKETNESLPEENKINNQNVNVIPGMDLESKENDEKLDSKDSDEKLNTKKDIKRILKKQATKKVQKSKVFQMKNNLERIKNKKRSHKTQSHGKVTKAGKKHAHKANKKQNVGKRKKIKH